MLHIIEPKTREAFKDIMIYAGGYYDLLGVRNVEVKKIILKKRVFILWFLKRGNLWVLEESILIL